jgi:hypothetical protein
MKDVTRRRFIKNAAIMGAAVTAFPTILVPKARAAWAKGTMVHPNVNNLKVVGVTDKKMTRDEDPSCSWSRQDELVVQEAVWENMDRLACALSETGQVEQAWRALFIKPPRKSWSDTVVAVKTNNIGRQHTRSAVMAKICHTLVGTLGVKPSHIHIYDACHGETMSRYTPFGGLPEGCRLENAWGGSTAYTAVPAPWKHGGGKAKCLRHLVDGSVYILVNVALCKGHSDRFGGFTMTMKNHFGTFSPGPGHQDGSVDYLLAINQTPEILGAMDGKTGRISYPRQQLCLVDALWASKGGPGSHPSHQPNFLAMGVLSPVVDYVMATRFRGEKMGWKPSMETTARMLAEFGFKEADLPEHGGIIGA